MGNCWKRGRSPVDGVRGRWSAWRLLTAWIVALSIAAAILLVFGQSMASADEPPDGKYGTQEAEVTIRALEHPMAWTLGEIAELRFRGTNGLSSEQLSRCTRRPC